MSHTVSPSEPSFFVLAGYTVFRQSLLKHILKMEAFLCSRRPWEGQGVAGNNPGVPGGPREGLPEPPRRPRKPEMMNPY